MYNRIGQMQTEVKRQTGAETNAYLPGIGGERRCGKYTIDGVTVERCAKCGNNICESFERCTSTTLDRYTGEESGDCGPLNCPQDCQQLK
ncbi:MAG TPA: hypothetical protein DIS54_03730 [Candidatus Veblenbacteria bacterium]|nr:hypothetical protein [Candidatus Veblenbacteria bacterium]